MVNPMCWLPNGFCPSWNSNQARQQGPTQCWPSPQWTPTLELWHLVALDLLLVPPPPCGEATSQGMETMVAPMVAVVEMTAAVEPTEVNGQTPDASAFRTRGQGPCLVHALV